MPTGPRAGDDESEHADESVQPGGVEREEREWKFSVDDFPDPGEPSSDTAENDEKDSNVAGTLDRDQPLEPGDIDAENAFFVALGILIVVGLIVGAMLGL